MTLPQTELFHSATPRENPISTSEGPAVSPLRDVSVPLGRLQLPLIDRFGRVHRSLRISVTDRCNIRCQYCMPEVASFLPTGQLLTFEEITQFVRVVATLGITDVRITGGEPLMRPGLGELLRQLNSTGQLHDLALTTNGMLLAQQLDHLVAAGLRRVNISLDTLSEAVFRRLSRRSGIEQVLAGIDAAAREPRLQVRLNALVMRDVNLDEVLELVAFARERSLPIRFIEFMPLDAERAWNRTQMVSGDEMRARLQARFGPLVPLEPRDASQPSTDYAFADGSGIVGFIDSVSKPFCGACDRLRLTADGKLRNCLFGTEEWDVRPLLRGTTEERISAEGATEEGATEEAGTEEAGTEEAGTEEALGDLASGALETNSGSARQAAIIATVRACLAAKRAAHGIDAPDFSPPERAMFQIGG